MLIFGAFQLPATERRTLSRNTDLPRVPPSWRDGIRLVRTRQAMEREIVFLFFFVFNYSLGYLVHLFGGTPPLQRPIFIPDMYDILRQFSSRSFLRARARVCDIRFSNFVLRNRSVRVGTYLKL